MICELCGKEIATIPNVVVVHKRGDLPIVKYVCESCAESFIKLVTLLREANS